MPLKLRCMRRAASAAIAVALIGCAGAIRPAEASDYSFGRTAGAVWQDGLFIGNGSHGVIAYAPAHLEWVVNKNDVFDRRVSKCDYVPHDEVMERIRTNAVKSVFFLRNSDRIKGSANAVDGLTRSITPAILRMRFWEGGVDWSAPSVPRTDQRVDMARGELVEEMRSPALAPQVTTVVPRGRDVVAMRLRNPPEPGRRATVELARPEDPRMESPPAFETDGDVVSFEQRLPYGDSYSVAVCATGKGDVVRSGMAARLRGDCCRDFFLAVRRSRKDAVAAVRAAATAGFDALRAENTAWWRGFWEQGATADFSSEPEIDRNWKYSLFALAGQFGAVPMPALNGLVYGPLDAGTAGVGFNCYVHDQNVQIPMLPFFTLNHCGFARTFAATYAACMDELKRRTKEVFGASAKGAYLPLNMNPDGVEHPVRHYRYTLCGSAYSGLVLAKAWQHSHDPELMKDLYPVLREFVRFYTSTMTRDRDGTCHFIWSVPPEIFTGSRDELAVVACLKPCLEAAVEGAALLNADAEEAAVWKDILAHYPPFARQSGGGWWGGPEIPDDHYMYGGHLFYPFFPAESDLDRDAAEKTLAYTWTNAVEIAWTTDEPHPNHEWSAFYTGTARMRLHGPTDGWKAMTDFLGWFCKPNGLFSHNPVIVTDMTREKMLTNRRRLPPLRLRGADGRISEWGRGDGLDLTASRDAKRLVCPVLEGGAAFLHLATEALMQSWSGEIRLFPCVPPGFTGRFSRFRAKGGLLVSAEMKNGRVVDFKVDGTGKKDSIKVTCPTDPKFETRTGCMTSAALAPGGVEIVVAKDASKVVKFAAKEMKHFLDGAFSCNVPVVDAPTGVRTPIHLGDNKWSREAGIAVEGMARDSFRIVVTGKAVFIAGRDDATADPERAFTRSVWSHHYERATLFGVYEFLERYVGVRMYFPGELGEIVPKARRIDVPAADFTVAPDMPGRSYSYFDEGAWFEGERRDAESTVRLRWLNSYRLRMQTRYLPFNHGLSHRGYLRRFGESHPEYFRLNKDGSRDVNLALGKRSGKLCYTSGVWEEIYQDAKSYLKGEDANVRGVINPAGDVGWWYSCQEGRFVDLMPHDGMVPCECAKCKAAYDANAVGNNYMNTIIWSNMAKIGNRLISEGVPGYVTQMAYQPYARVPDVALPPNILVMVAKRGPWSVPYPDDLKHEYADIAAWAKKLGRKVAIWTYPCKYGKRNVPNIPSLSPWAWGRYYKDIAPWVSHIFAQSDSDRFIHHHLDHYVLSRVAWNTKVDVDAAIDEYFQLMYGAAAPEMKALFRSLERKWTVGFLSRGENTVWGPSFNVASPEDRWGRVYTAELLAKYDLLFDRALKKTAEGSLERRRVELMRRELLEPLVAEREAFAGLADRLAKVNFRFCAGKPLALRPCGKPKEAVVPADLRTEVHVQKGVDGLVVRVTAYEPKMRDVVALKRAFDNEDVWTDNAVEVMVDPTGARREYMHFMVNSAGSWSDLVHRKDKSGNWANDWKWNSGAKVAVRRFSNRWTCEIAIPSANFPDGIPQRFPAEAFRNRVLKANTNAKDMYIWGMYSTGPCDFDNFGTWEIVVSGGK